jgi:lipid II:glycine glycyltransferase (peptidoglycan interpeptide bridge formation enzyme)
MIFVSSEIKKLKFINLSQAVIWFANEKSASHIEKALSNFMIVSLKQADKNLSEKFSEYTVKVEPFYTTIIDLSIDEATLWSKLDKKSTRYEIKKAEKMGVEISLNVQLDDAYELINQFMINRRLRGAIPYEKWQSILKYADVWCGIYNGNLYVAHVLLKDDMDRVRLLWSATRDRSSTEVKKIIGAINRYMHWREILYYKNIGVRIYDFGGVNLDKKSPTYTITQFKLSFGGDIIEEYDILLTSNAILRVLFKSKDFIHRKIKKILSMKD